MQENKRLVIEGIDVSHWNKVNDCFEGAVKEGYQFVMLKYGGEEKKFGKINRDKKFFDYYSQAKYAGLHVGCYFFMCTDDLWKTNAHPIVDEFISRLDGLQFDMPIVLDVENQNPNNKAVQTEYVFDFCKALEDAGYYAMIYGSDIATFHDCLETKPLERFDKWVASYAHIPRCMREYGIWQWHNEGRVKGISGVVDLNYAYKDYPYLIKNSKLNHFKEGETK